MTSDFIVGFCGETEEDFQKTYDLVAECRFKNSFIFKYSERPGTKGAELYADDVPVRGEEPPQQRAARAAEPHQRAGQPAVPRPARARCSSKGRASGPNTAAKTRATCVQLTGRTPDDRIVVFDGNPRLIGQIIPVAIYDVAPHTLFGAVVTEHVGPACNFSANPADACTMTASAILRPMAPPASGSMRGDARRELAVDRDALARRPRLAGRAGPTRPRAADVLAQAAVCAAPILASAPPDSDAALQWLIEATGRRGNARRSDAAAAVLSTQSLSHSAHSVTRSAHLYEPFLHALRPNQPQTATASSSRRSRSPTTSSAKSTRLLRDDFGLPDGLAAQSAFRNPQFRNSLLDPACGTGVFLLAVIDLPALAAWPTAGTTSSPTCCRG